MRKLRLANAQKRDAEVVYGGIPKKSSIHYTLPDGTFSKNIKILKAPINLQYESLLEKFGSDEELAKQLVEGNPEIDLQLTGKIITNSQRILVNQDQQPMYKVKVTELVYNPDGTLKEEKEQTQRSQNIMLDVPVSWTGKYLKLDEVYNKFIFGKKYQLTHTNGLTYDFLYGMAKDLFEKQSVMLIAAGTKGNEPLIFQENGKPYRAFLEGRIKGESYILLMHISNLELKPIV